jgi:hypothetical protein
VGSLHRRGRQDADQPLHERRREETLIRLLRYVGATDSDIADVRESIFRWCRGSVFIDLAPGRKNLLRIRLPWAEQLDPS